MVTNLTFGNNSATFTWHATPHSLKERRNSTIYFAVTHDKEIKEFSESCRFILLAPINGLLCYA